VSGQHSASRLGRWLTEPVPRGRVAAFRTLVYLFIAADLVVFTPWVRMHASVPGELYQPLLAGRLLALPTPTPLLVNRWSGSARRAGCARSSITGIPADQGELRMERRSNEAKASLTDKLVLDQRSVGL
jgi:hypothetical protein